MDRERDDRQRGTDHKIKTYNKQQVSHPIMIVMGWTLYGLNTSQIKKEKSNTKLWDTFRSE